MDLKAKLMQAVLQFVPDRHDPLIGKSQFIGKPINRVDGKLKVTGEALFAAEYQIENMAYAAIVCSTIAKGKIDEIDTTEAENAPGVVGVITHKNRPKMKNPPLMDTSGGSSGASPDGLPILGDRQIFWNGQPIAIVVAETQEQAEFGASTVKVTYKTKKPKLSFDSEKHLAKAPKQVMGQPPEVKVGDAIEALKKCHTSVDHTYRTPRYNHNAIEPHATIAMWSDRDELTVFDATQNLYSVRNTLAATFNVSAEMVNVVSPFVGGGFGGKGCMWQHTALCAAASRIVKRPVKLALSREDVFRIVGGRTPSEQRVALGVNDANKFVALIHAGITATTEHNDFAEQFSFPARFLYESETFDIAQKVVYLDTLANTFMRAPGESIGTFALESAIDELADKLEIDPIELRRLNEPKQEPLRKIDFSLRNLVEAYRRGAERFGWNRQKPGTQRDGKWMIGQGVATAYYPYYRFPGTARVRIDEDGRATVQAAAHEMGMGTATVQIQHAAERLGIPIEQVSFEYGNTNLPESPQAGGSNQTASVIASVTAAIRKIQHEFFILERMQKNSVFSGELFENVVATESGLSVNFDSVKRKTYVEILKEAGKHFVEVEASSEMPLEIQKHSMHSYGAQFCEVRVNSESGEVRVTRWVGSFDAGTILNPKTAESQFRGGIIMGIGMALTEETLFDERYGRIVNPSLSEYHIPVHLDIPVIEVIYNNIPDPLTPMGARGIGEIGITGAAAAVANAIYNATGKRVRDLPITLDKLL